MKKITTLTLSSILAFAGASSFADNLIFVNRADSNNFGITANWYDYDAYSTGSGSARYVQVGNAPTASDNIFLIGYTDSVTADTGGVDSLGNQIYRINASINTGNGLTVNNFTMDIASDFMFKGQTSAGGDAWINAFEGSALTVNGTFTNTSGHRMILNNGNAPDGYIFKANTFINNGSGQLAFNSGIKELYIGTLDGVTKSGTMSSNAAGSNLQIFANNVTQNGDGAASPTNVYMGDFTNYGDMTFRGNTNGGNAGTIGKINLNLVGDFINAKSTVGRMVIEDTRITGNGSIISSASAADGMTLRNVIFAGGNIVSANSTSINVDTTSSFESGTTTTFKHDLTNSSTSIAFNWDTNFNPDAIIDIETKSATSTGNSGQVQFFGHESTPVRDVNIRNYTVENANMDVWVGRKMNLKIDNLDLKNSSTGGATFKGGSNRTERWDSHVSINNMTVDETSALGFGNEGFIFDSVSIKNLVNNSNMGHSVQIQSDKVSIGTISNTLTNGDWRQTSIRLLGGANNSTNNKDASLFSFEKIEVNKMAFLDNKSGIIVSAQPFGADGVLNTYYANDAFVYDMEVQDLGEYGFIQISSGVSNQTLNLILNVDNSAGRKVFKGFFDQKDSTLNIIKTGAGKQIIDTENYNYNGSITVEEGTLAMNYGGSSMGEVIIDGGYFGRADGTLNITSIEVSTGGFYYDLGYDDFTLIFPSIADLTFTPGNDFDENSFIFENIGEFLDAGSNRAYLLDFENGAALMSELGDLVDLTAIYDGIYEGTFGYDSATGQFYIDFIVVPEPSTYAAIFGLLALALAIYRRRK